MNTFLSACAYLARVKDSGDGFFPAFFPVPMSFLILLFARGAIHPNGPTLHTIHTRLRPKHCHHYPEAAHAFKMFKCICHKKVKYAKATAYLGLYSKREAEHEQKMPCRL